MYFEPLNLET